ncbi:MAG: 2'-5' RNA ligase family protein [Pseudonocardiaceae bacterium]
MRLFVALTPPDEVVEALRVCTHELRECAPELRWTRPEQWHVTLAFLGEVGSPSQPACGGAPSLPSARHLGPGGR